MTDKFEVTAFMLCDAVIDDRMTGKKTLVGIFNQIRAPAVPCVHAKFTVFVALEAPPGTYDISLRCVCAADGAAVFQLDGPLTVDPGSVGPQELIFELNSITFPRYGEYRFDVLTAGELRSSRRYFVLPQPPRQPLPAGRYN